MAPLASGSAARFSEAAFSGTCLAGAELVLERRFGSTPAKGSFLSSAGAARIWGASSRAAKGSSAKGSLALRRVRLLFSLLLFSELEDELLSLFFATSLLVDEVFLEAAASFLDALTLTPAKGSLERATAGTALIASPSTPAKGSFANGSRFFLRRLLLAPSVGSEVSVGGLLDSGSPSGAASAAPDEGASGSGSEGRELGLASSLTRYSPSSLACALVRHFSAKGRPLWVEGATLRNSSRVLIEDSHSSR